MGHSMDRHRMENRHRVLGDTSSAPSKPAASSSSAAKDAPMYAAMVAEAGKSIAQLIAEQDAKSAAEKAQKDAEAKAAADKVAADKAAQVAQAARTKANLDAAAARTAQLKAQAEPVPYGPLHVAAQNAADRAAMSDSEASRLEAEAARLAGGGMGALKSLKMGGGGEGIFTTKNILIGLGVAVGGVVAWKLLRRK